MHIIFGFEEKRPGSSVWVIYTVLIYAGNTKEADVALELSTKQSFFEIGDNISPSIYLG